MVATYATDLNLTGHFDTGPLKHTLLIGGDYYRTDFSRALVNAAGGFPTVDINTLVHSASILPDLTARTNYEQNTDNYGFYLQDQIKLPYNVHVLGGFRYQYIHQKSVTECGGATTCPDGTNAGFGPTLTDDAVTPRVGVLWQAQNWLSVYGNYVENFGPNTNGATLASNKPLPPTSAQQWEIGAKAELFEGRLRATLAYFDLTKQNVATQLPNSIYADLIGEVRSQGPELDIQGELLPGWNLIATYANQDVRITKGNIGVSTYQNPQNNLIGQRLWNTPRNIGSLWSTYEFQQGDLTGLKLGAGIWLRDGVTDFYNVQKSAGYATVDLLAAYSMKFGKTKVTAQLNVNNLLDKENFTTIGAFPSLYTAQGAFLTPRTFMGSLKLEY
jgi:iron complex outermembrane receptor protein